MYMPFELIRINGSSRELLVDGRIFNCELVMADGSRQFTLEVKGSKDWIIIAGPINSVIHPEVTRIEEVKIVKPVISTQVKAPSKLKLDLPSPESVASFLRPATTVQPPKPKMGRPPKVRIVSTEKLAHVVKPEKKQVRRLPFDKEPVKKWAERDGKLAQFIKEKCGGSFRLIDLSDGLKKVVDELSSTATSVGLSVGLNSSVSIKLLNLQKLHHELKPFLDLPTPLECRISLSAASVLSQIELAHQVSVWNISKNEPNETRVIAKIHEVGKGHFIRTRKYLNSRSIVHTANSRSCLAAIGYLKFSQGKLATLQMDHIADYVQVMGKDRCLELPLMFEFAESLMRRLKEQSKIVLGP